MNIFDFIEAKRNRIFLEYERKEAKSYNEMVYNYFISLIKDFEFSALNVRGNIVKLKSVKDNLDEMASNVMDIFDEAESRARQGDEEDERTNFEDEWYMDHDEDEDVNWSEFEYEEHDENVIQLMDLYMTDISNNVNLKGIKNYVDIISSEANRRSNYAQEYVDKVYSDIKQLSEEFGEILEDRIKFEKRWYKILKKNMKKAFKAVFENFNLSKYWED